MPAYIVLSDKSLLSLVNEKPTNLHLFGNAYGIGEHKKKQYGDRFVDLICSHLGVARTPEPSNELALTEDFMGQYVGHRNVGNDPY